MLEARNLVEKIEPNLHTVPHGDRSNAVLEPFLTDQWYVDAKKLGAACDRSGRKEAAPSSSRRTGRRPISTGWRTSEPWNISRQLWWGHQIPAWYGPKFLGAKESTWEDDKERSEWFVAHTEDEAIQQAKARYGRAVRVIGGKPTDSEKLICLPKYFQAGRFRFFATPTSSTPGSPRRCGRSRRSAGPTRRRN